MRLIMCAVRDRAADAYARPMFVPSVGIAIRSFSDEVNRKAEDNQMYNHADDFDLYELGVYDDETAKFEILDTPKQLAIGKQVRISE